MHLIVTWPNRFSNTFLIPESLFRTGLDHRSKDACHPIWGRSALLRSFVERSDKFHVLAVKTKADKENIPRPNYLTMNIPLDHSIFRLEKGSYQTGTVF